jgi:hypothetical protein
MHSLKWKPGEPRESKGDPLGEPGGARVNGFSSWLLLAPQGISRTRESQEGQGRPGGPGKARQAREGQEGQGRPGGPGKARRAMPPLGLSTTGVRIA